MDHDQTIEELMKIGVFAHDEQRTILQLGKHCAKTVGLPMAATFGVAGIKAGSITVPGIGTVAVSVAAAAAGLVIGTLTCSIMNISMQDELRRFAKDAAEAAKSAKAQSPGFDSDARLLP